MQIERQQEIAHKILVARVTEGGGIPSKRKLHEELTAISKATGVSFDELHELFVDLLPSILAGIFGVKKVEVTFFK